MSPPHLANRKTLLIPCSSRSAAGMASLWAERREKSDAAEVVSTTRNQEGKEEEEES